MRLIGVRSLLECDEALTNARSPRLLTRRPWFPSLLPAALDQARRCPSEAPLAVHWPGASGVSECDNVNTFADVAAWIQELQERASSLERKHARAIAT